MNENLNRYDAKIFAFATLITSHLMYTSIRLVDQNAVDYLELLARRAQLFQLKASLDSRTDLPLVLRGQDFPPLTWVVKDFVQKTDGENMNEMKNDSFWFRTNSTRMVGIIFERKQRSFKIE